MGLLDSAGVSYLLGLIKGTFLAKEDTATVAISGKFTDLTNLPTTLLGYGIKDAYTIDQIKALITALFTYGGSCTFANLPTPSASNVNHVYNVTEPFTTTSSFMEGAGGWYPAGTDVVVVAVTNNGTTTYVYDSFTGLIDLSPYLKIADLKSSVITAFGYTPVNPSSLSVVAISGKYSDLSGTPSLSAVAASGKYSDLSGIPTIPTEISSLNNDAGYVKTSTSNVTLSSASWNSSAITVSLASATATSTIKISPSSGMTSTQYDAFVAAKIIPGTQSAGSFILTALGTVPTVDIPVQVTIWG